MHENRTVFRQIYLYNLAEWKICKFGALLTIYASVWERARRTTRSAEYFSLQRIQRQLPYSNCAPFFVIMTKLSQFHSENNFTIDLEKAPVNKDNAWLVTNSCSEKMRVKRLSQASSSCSLRRFHRTLTTEPPLSLHRPSSNTWIIAIFFFSHLNILNNGSSVPNCTFPNYATGCFLLKCGS